MSKSLHDIRDVQEPREEYVYHKPTNNTIALSSRVKFIIAGTIGIIAVGIIIGVPTGLLLNQVQVNDTVEIKLEAPTETETILIEGEAKLPGIPAIVELETLSKFCSVELGSCEPIVCEKQNGVRMCPAILISEEVVKECEGETHEFTSALTCKCEECEIQVISKLITGTVTSGSNTPVQYASVRNSTSEVTVTNGDGSFSFFLVVDEDNTDVEITIEPPETLSLMSSVKIVNLKTDDSEIVLNIKLGIVKTTVNFSSSNDVVINLGTEDNQEGGFADMEVPKNSVVLEDGTTYNGEVTVSMGVMDTDNEEDIDLTPTFETDDNDTMVSEGFFQPRCQTSDGNDCTLNNVTIEVAPNPDASEEELENLNLWVLGDDNKFKSIGKFEQTSTPSGRRKRRNTGTLVATANFGSFIYNLDYYRVPYCYIKVRVYHSNSFALNNQAMEYWIKTTYRGSVGWLSYQNRQSYYSYSGTCAQIPCQNAAQMDGYTLRRVKVEDLQGFTGSDYGIKNSDSDYAYEISMNSPILNGDQGPIFGKYDWWSCYRSTGYHLSFYSDRPKLETNAIPFKERYLPWRYTYHPKFWWPDRWNYTACFLTIAVYSEQKTEELQVTAASYGGNVEPIKDKWIGSRISYAKVDRNIVVGNKLFYFGVGIVEYKCSAKVYQGETNDIDRTFVTTTLPENCELKRLNSELETLIYDSGTNSSFQNSNSTDSRSFSFNAPEGDNKEVLKKYGIYSDSSPSGVRTWWSYSYRYSYPPSYGKKYAISAFEKVANETVEAALVKYEGTVQMESSQVLEVIEDIYGDKVSLVFKC